MNFHLLHGLLGGLLVVKVTRSLVTDIETSNLVIYLDVVSERLGLFRYFFSQFLKITTFFLD